MSGNYGWGLPVAASSAAAEVDFGLHLMHGAMLAIFVGWSIFFVYLLIKYRAREGVAVDTRQDAAWKSLIPDAFVLVFEIALIAFYAVPAWSRLKVQAPKPEDCVQIRVVAEQFAWNVHYPGPDGLFGRTGPSFIDSGNVLGLDPDDPAGKDDLTTLNELHLPVGRQAMVWLTSKDVIHSFFVPEFRIKQDAVPGLESKVWFTPTRAGTYEIACAQLCGNAHAMMRGDVIVEDSTAFSDWLKAQQAAK